MSSLIWKKKIRLQHGFWHKLIDICECSWRKSYKKKNPKPYSRFFFFFNLTVFRRKSTVIRKHVFPLLYIQHYWRQILIIVVLGSVSVMMKSEINVFGPDSYTDYSHIQYITRKVRYFFLLFFWHCFLPFYFFC